MDGDNYLVDEDGDFWRMYIFIEDATCFDIVEKPEDFYNSALSFGNFQKLLQIILRQHCMKRYRISTIP